MVYNITGPQKLEIINSFFETNKFKLKTIVDIGGNSDSYAFFRNLFPSSKIYTANNYSGHLNVSNPIVLDAEKDKLPFKTNSVDCIILLDIIEHLINPTFILSEAKRALKKGGLLIITTPNLAMFYNRFFLLFGWSFSNYHTCIYKTGNPFLKIKSVGNLWNENAHKSVFTFLELKELIKEIYKFDILGLTGFSYSNAYATGSDSTYGVFRKYLNYVVPNSLKEGMLLIAKK